MIFYVTSKILSVVVIVAVISSCSGWWLQKIHQHPLMSVPPLSNSKASSYLVVYAKSVSLVSYTHIRLL